VPDTTLNLPNVPGSKKLIYTHLNMPLVAIEDFEKMANENAIYDELDAICKRNGGLWSVEAEAYLLENAERFGLK
jgi:hypothetical protein